MSEGYIMIYKVKVAEEEGIETDTGMVIANNFSEAAEKLESFYGLNDIEEISCKYLMHDFPDTNGLIPQEKLEQVLAQVKEM